MAHRSDRPWVLRWLRYRIVASLELIFFWVGFIGVIWLAAYLAQRHGH